MRGQHIEQKPLCIVDRDRIDHLVSDGLAIGGIGRDPSIECITHEVPRDLSILPSAALGEPLSDLQAG